MKTPATLPIIIAGGGVGGLTAAIALGKKGFRVKLLEQADEFQPIGYGIQLGPNAFHMFDRLGLTQSILRYCNIPQAGIMRDIMSGEEVTRLPMGAALEQRYGRPYAVIHRGDLHEALLQACAALSNVELLTSSKVEKFEDCGQHVVVTMADGKTHWGTALIGADGVWSAIRSQMNPSVIKPQSLGYVAYRGLKTRAEIPPDLFENNVVLWAGPGYHMMQYPLQSDQLFNIVAVFRSRRFARGEANHSGPDELQEIFSGACSHVRRLLESVQTDKHWDIAVMEPVPHWSSGRVALLGDSAHAMLQAMAQGACQAIEDGVWIAEYIAHSAGDFKSAFAAYQHHRQLRAVRMQYQSRFYWEVYHASGVYADLRKHMLTRSPQDAIESLSWVYEKPVFPDQMQHQGAGIENLSVQ
jgi:2-polyprenyl-6-methoxyphenol hydroxylase-like FAD-dependent oxidoreductase